MFSHFIYIYKDYITRIKKKKNKEDYITVPN